MNTETKITISILFLFLWVAILFVNVQHPTRFEVIAIYDSLIKADSNTIYDIQYAGRLERYILIQGLVLTGELPPEALYSEIQWFIDRNEQRIEEKNERFRD